MGFTQTNASFPLVLIFHSPDSTEPYSHPLPYSLILPLKLLVISEQTEVEVSLHWTLLYCNGYY